MKIAAIQHNIAWADRTANFAHLAPLIEEAASQGAEFIVLSEMFSTGFVVDQPDIAEPIGGASSQFLVEMASRHGVWVAGSCPEAASDDARPYNSLVLASPDAHTTRYSKIHPFTYGGEDKHYRPGTDHITVQVKNVRVSLFVCYDLRFADEFWTLAPSTDLYVVPANWPESRREHWMALLRARAIENQAYVLGVNRVGDGGGLHYVGDSQIIDPLGNVSAAPHDGEYILYADVNPTLVRDTREHFPFLQDRRS
jgi:predicted amidohydrolase